jgi:flagellar basal-body rod protein FlgF
VIKGLYSAFMAMEAAWRYQDVLANNIANANTAGFKREIASQQSFQDVLLSQQAPVPAPLTARIQAVVGQIGTGTFIAEFATDYQDGMLQNTGNELDLALGRGFFQVEAPDGQVFLTRDGRFGRDANGDLVNSQGYYVLNDQGGHINLPAERVDVASDGTIATNGQPVDRIGIFDYSPVQLARAGEAYFTSTEAGVAIDGALRQGFLEGSNTSLVEEMTTLLAVQRTYSANQTILSTLDETLNLAAGQLGTFGV